MNSLLVQRECEATTESNALLDLPLETKDVHPEVSVGNAEPLLVGFIRTSQERHVNLRS